MRRQQGKRAARAGRQALHNAFEFHIISVKIRYQIHALADFDIRQLCFFEIHVHPQFRHRHNRHQRCARADLLTQLHAAFGDLSRHGRDNLRTPHCQPCFFKLAGCRQYVGLLFQRHGVAHRVALRLFLRFGGTCFGLCSLQCGAGVVQSVFGVRRFFCRYGIDTAQGFAAFPVGFGFLHGDLGALHVGQLRCRLCLRRVHGRMQPRVLAHRLNQLAARFFQCQHGVVVVQHRQHLPGLNGVVVVHQNLADASGNLCGNLHQMPVHISVFGAFLILPCAEVLHAPINADGGENQGQHQQRCLVAARCACGFCHCVYLCDI